MAAVVRRRRHRHTPAVCLHDLAGAGRLPGSRALRFSVPDLFDAGVVSSALRNSVLPHEAAVAAADPFRSGFHAETSRGGVLPPQSNAWRARAFGLRGQVPALAARWAAWRRLGTQG